MKEKDFLSFEEYKHLYLGTFQAVKPVTAKIEIVIASQMFHLRGSFPKKGNEKFFYECAEYQLNSPIIVWVKNDIVVCWGYRIYFHQLRNELKHLWLQLREDKQIASAKWLDGNHCHLEVEMKIEEILK